LRARSFYEKRVFYFDLLVPALPLLRQIIVGDLSDCGLSLIAALQTNTYLLRIFMISLFKLLPVIRKLDPKRLTADSMDALGLLLRVP